MNSLAAAEETIYEVIDRKNKENADSVKRVKVSIGELSGINGSQFAKWFRTLSIGSPAENSELIIKREPGMARCICGYEGLPENIFGEGKNLIIECGKCNSTFVTPITGKGHDILEIELSR